MSRRKTLFQARALVVVAICVGLSDRARAQTPQICTELIKMASTEQDFYAALLPSEAAVCIMQAAFPGEVPNASQAFHSSYIGAAAKLQSSSNGIQTGATTSAAGTTSAVSKPFSPLSLATEYGGITSSTSNQTVTLQIPLDGIPRALANKGLVLYCAIPSMRFKPEQPPDKQSTKIQDKQAGQESCVNGDTLDILDRFSFSVSMNTSTPTNSVTATATGASSGGAQPVTGTSQGGSTPSFSGATAKIVLWKPTAKLPSLTSTSPSVVASIAHSPKASALNQMLQNTKYETWRRCVAAALAAAPAANRDTVAAPFFSQLQGIIQSGQDVTNCPQTPRPATVTVMPNDLLAALQTDIIAASVQDANFASDVFKALGDPALSFEYDVATPLNQESNSTFKFVGTKGWFVPKDAKNMTGAPRLTGTINIGASIFNGTPSSSVPGSSLLRTLQAGSELDYTVPTSKLPGFLSKIGDSTASLAYYYQDQTSPSILKVTPGTPLTGVTLVGLSSSATQIFTQKGPIHVGQFKYGLGTGKNVKFPLAVTYASRTELIVHHTWGAEFGVSYDFTSLFSGSGGAQPTQ